jgi:recombination protein RecA
MGERTVATKTSERGSKKEKSNIDPEMQKNLKNAIETIDKKFGTGTIMTLGSRPNLQVDSIPSGSVSLDYALGVGGFPRGRITEIFGPESSGKTTLALHVIASAQKEGGMAAFIDAEHALDPAYAKRIGVDLDRMLISQPDCGEQALEIVELLAASNSVAVIVIDSVAALVPRAELEGEMDDQFMGLHARLMSKGMRKLTSFVKNSNTCVIFVNQIRDKIGVMFGSPETTTGGRALKFFSSLRVDIRKISTIKKSDDLVLGIRAKVSVVKNKVAPPFRKAEFDILFNKGISFTGDLVDIASKADIITKAGTWFSYGEHKLGQGRENAINSLEENPELLAKIEEEVRKKLFPLNQESMSSISTNTTSDESSKED